MSLSCCVCFSIYIVHDEVKDKAFELELSWVGEGEWYRTIVEMFFTVENTFGAVGLRDEQWKFLSYSIHIISTMILTRTENTSITFTIVCSYYHYGGYCNAVTFCLSIRSVWLSCFSVMLKLSTEINPCEIGHCNSCSVKLKSGNLLGKFEFCVAREYNPLGRALLNDDL